LKIRQVDGELQNMGMLCCFDDAGNDDENEDENENEDGDGDEEGDEGENKGGKSRRRLKVKFSSLIVHIKHQIARVESIYILLVCKVKAKSLYHV
jgi:hypothetical protein